jgi:GT2 family glycosyltransferase
LQRLLDHRELLSTLRVGIPPVRSLDDDARAALTLYRELLGARAKKEQHRARVAAVVLNYRAPDQTALAVRALERSRRPLYELIVVDNDESGECDAALRAAGCKIAPIRAGGNLGFAGGVNVGIRAAIGRGASRILLVNSDAIVPPECLSLLDEALDANPSAGIAAPVLVDRMHPDRLLSRGLSFNPTSGRVRVLGPGEPAVAPERKSARATPPTEVQAVSGCAMLIDRRVFERAGLFDEAYFFSFEDLEFCLRAKRAGFATLIIPEAVAYHEGSRSIGAGSTQRLYFAARNHLRFARQAAPIGPLQRTIRDCSIVALNVAHAALRARGATLPSRLGAVIRGARDHVTGRFGPGA